MTTEDLRKRVHALLATAGVEFEEYEHEPVYDYDVAEQVRKRFGLTGTESKSVFLKAKDGQFVMFISLEGRRLDSRRAKELVGSKLSFADDDDLKARTGCEPGCAVPFGLPDEIPVLVDEEIFSVEKLIFSPGPPDKTIEIEGSTLPTIVSSLPNHVYRYTAA